MNRPYSVGICEDSGWFGALYEKKLFVITKCADHAQQVVDVFNVLGIAPIVPNQKVVELFPYGKHT